jgi:membrane protein DedA with SNARE-associated domain
LQRLRYDEPKKFLPLIRKYGGKIVFASKFVYGTRFIVMNVAGAVGVRFNQYLLGTITGEIGYYAIVFGLIKLLHTSLSSLSEVANILKIIGLIALATLFVLQRQARGWLSRKTEELSRDSTYLHA